MNKVISSWSDVRCLISKYEDNLDLVDPQLKNNPELIKVLQGFEEEWGKGKFFLSNDEFPILASFSKFLED